MRRNLSRYLITAFILLLTISTTVAASVQWRSYSNSAFANAKAQHKLVLIYGKSEFCHWCTKMNKDTLSDSGISSIIARKYIPVAIDVVTDKALAAQYNINGTPTFIILDENRKQITASYGYQSVSAFKSFLESI